MGGNKVLFGNVYATSGDLPVAASYHGMFAHVHATGKGYFAHGGNWVELANASDIPTITGHSNLVAWDLADTTNSKVLDAGTAADSAWYYGDVVSDPANPATSVVLDISASTPTFAGNVMGEVHGDVKTADGGTLILDVDAGAGTAMYDGDVTGNITSSGSSEFSGTVDFTGAAVTGITTIPARTTASGTTLSIADAATDNLDITGFKAYNMLSIQTSGAAWVRIYANASSRTADASRNETSDPVANSGVIAEVITTGAETILLTPGVFGFNAETVPTTNIPCAVTNKTGSTGTVTVTLTLLQAEV